MTLVDATLNAPRCLVVCRSYTGLACTLMLMSMACNQGDEDNPFVPIPVTNSDTQEADHGGDLDALTPDLTTFAASFCAPGTRRCLAEHSPLSQLCDEEGGAWRADPCPDQFICEEGACVPFSCTPDRPICLGATTRAVCASTGRSVVDVVACDSPLSCLAGTCVDRCEIATRNGSYDACAFIATPLDNLSHRLPESADSPLAVIAANPHPLLPAIISMTSPQGVSIPRIGARTLTPGSSYSLGERTTVRSEILRPDGTTRPIDPMNPQITLEPGEAAALLVDASTPGPYRLKSTQPIVAYQFNPYCCNFTASNDASLLLPTGRLGTSYRVVNYPTMFYAPADLETPYLTIIADEEPSTVRIDSPAPLILKERSGGPSTTPSQAGMSVSISLAPGESATFEIPSDDFTAYQQNQADISGALVTATTPVAVFSGHPCTFVPQDAWACDHLEEQLIPADTLGKRYVLPTIARRSETSQDRSREGIYWRIVAHEDALITTSPALVDAPTLDTSTFATRGCVELLDDAGALQLAAGEVCEVGLSQAISLSSDAPLIIAGVISGHESTGQRDFGTQAGDPAMFLLPPVRQFRKEYSFVTSPTFKKTFAVFTIPPDTQISHQGASLQPERVHAASSIAGVEQGWDIFSIDLTPGLHTVGGTRAFGLVVYAYDDYVSYAFPAGLDLVNQTKE